MGEFLAFLYSRSDAVLMSAMQLGFWLIVTGLILLLFRAQISNLLAGLSIVKMAGVSIQLSDKRDQIEAYFTLGEAFVGMLSQPGVNVDAFWHVFPSAQIERLNFFVLKYLKETNKELVNLELTRNIALLLMRHGRYKQSLAILEKLSALYPLNDSIQAIKASTLLHSRVHKNLEDALKLYKDLCARFPLEFGYRGNYCCCFSQLGKHAEAMQVLDQIISEFSYARAKAIFEWDLLYNTKIGAPELFKETTRVPDDVSDNGLNQGEITGSDAQHINY